MRDIHGDLQDRANLIEEQMNAAHAQFEQRLAQLKSERDARVEELKGELGAVGKLMDAEQRRFASPSRVPTLPEPLGDFLIRKLSENGPMSGDDLRLWTPQEGYFADPESAARAVQVTLVNGIRAGRIRQLPDGTFAPATLLTDAIRLRRVV
jgi:hypothetical protein